MEAWTSPEGDGGFAAAEMKGSPPDCAHAYLRQTVSGWGLAAASQGAVSGRLFSQSAGAIKPAVTSFSCPLRPPTEPGPLGAKFPDSQAAKNRAYNLATVACLEKPTSSEVNQRRKWSLPLYVRCAAGRRL